jgi:shikimate dehydrogenase
MHNAAFAVLGLDAVYVALRVSGPRLGDAMRLLIEGGGGGNVTVPHKEAAAREVDRMIAPAGLSAAGVVERSGRDGMGACNTFWGDADALVGTNTDVVGVLAGLDQIAAPATTWLVIGTGGGSQAVLAAARVRGARVAIQSRSHVRAESLLAMATRLGVSQANAAECEVAINATPLGLGPGDPLPLDPAGFPGLRWGLDLVYAPGETRWVRLLRSRGLFAADGREVVVAQGAAALEHWFPGVRAPVEVMRAAVRAALESGIA